MVHLWAYVCSFILGRTGPVQVSEHGVSSLLLASCRIELRSLALARVPLPAQVPYQLLGGNCLTLGPILFLTHSFMCALMDWVDRSNLLTSPSLPVPLTSPSTTAVFPFHLHVLFSFFLKKKLLSLFSSSCMWETVGPPTGSTSMCRLSGIVQLNDIDSPFPQPLAIAQLLSRDGTSWAPPSFYLFNKFSGCIFFFLFCLFLFVLF